MGFTFCTTRGEDCSTTLKFKKVAFGELSTLNLSHCSENSIFLSELEAIFSQRKDVLLFLRASESEGPTRTTPESPYTEYRLSKSPLPPSFVRELKLKLRRHVASLFRRKLRQMSNSPTEYRQEGTKNPVNQNQNGNQNANVVGDDAYVEQTNEQEQFQNSPSDSTEVYFYEESQP